VHSLFTPPEISRGSGARSTGPSLMETVATCEVAKRRGQFDVILACLCPNARIETIASEWRPVSPPEAVEAIQAALGRDPYYLEGQWGYEQVAPDVVLTTTPVRERSPGGGVRHRTVYRVTTGRAGLIWRQRLFRTREEALRCWREHGLELGL
jgi:hypothetical protein